jgi:hypothetical protein
VLVPLALALLGAAPVAAEPGAEPERPASVLVVGIPGLRWSDVGEGTPTLQRLAQQGAVGLLSVKAVPPVTCPADGWLTLGAGNRAVAADIDRTPCGPQLPADLAASRAANAQEREGARLGALADALDGCVDAVGAGPRLAVVGPPASGRTCPLVLRAAPAVTGDATHRAAAAVLADSVLGALLRDVAPDTVLVVGLSAAPGEDTASLHVAVAEGDGVPRGALRSASTRRAPYVQLVDVAPTVLDLLGREVPEAVDRQMTGQPWQVVGQAPTPEELADLALHARAQQAVTVPFFVALLGAQLLLLLLAAWRRRAELAELVALGGVVAVAASYLANLVPWWRSPAPLLTLLAVVVVVSGAVVAALSAPRVASLPAGGTGERGVLRPVGLACAFVAAVLLGDLLTGAHLQVSSVAGYSPLVAGRFAGIGNVAFGVLAASALLGTAALTRRAAVVAALGALTVVVDGAPTWGSDVGGVLALVPAFTLLALLLSGRRVSVLRLASAGVAGAAVVTAFAVADWTRRPADRTHLGRFVQDVLDGTPGTLLRRKSEAVLGLLFANPVTALLPLVVAAAVWLVVRPPTPLRTAFTAAPAWRSGLAALGLASAVGFAVNDSGAAVPALALVVALPATVAVVLRARRAAERDAPLLA